MATITRFEDLDVWKKSMKISILIYNLFKNVKDYGMKDQIQRAVVSIPSNISEGFERISDKDSARFYTIAKGSAGEVRTQIYLSYALGYINLEEKNELIAEIERISKMLFQLISYKNQKSLGN
jgi:four helix bundle protein